MKLIAFKRIALEKYKVIKKQILAILGQSELTHTELMEQLYANVKDTFEGGVQWYGETPMRRSSPD
jgi:hypothetical protein